VDAVSVLGCVSLVELQAVKVTRLSTAVGTTMKDLIRKEFSWCSG
jgi:hypothetical protein